MSKIIHLALTEVDETLRFFVQATENAGKIGRRSMSPLDTGNPSSPPQQLSFHLDASAKIAEKLRRDMSVHDFARGTVLARRGDPATRLYFLLDGFVATTATSPQANDYIIAFFKAGDTFLLCSVMAEKPSPVSISVLRDSRIGMLPADVFRAAVNTDHRLALSVAKTLAEQRLALAAHIRDLKVRRPAARLAAFLLRLCKEGEVQADLTLPCDRRILSGWLGMVPASTARTFRELEAIGVGGRGRQISIASVERLKDFVQSEP
jgi:CRP/FNR family transcriptional regulator, dissimilatory nitrate respiration regulator